jgi:tetratricopeptide (TPR) repeat protein
MIALLVMVLLPFADVTAAQLAEEAAALAQAGKYEAARDKLWRARKLEPENAVVERELGKVREALGDRGAAVQSYHRYLKLLPEAPDANEIRARIARLIPEEPSPSASPTVEVAPTCPTGQAVSADTQGHCCWPGQAWSSARSLCVGEPACPPGTRPRGESCESACATGQSITADTQGHCCWPGQRSGPARAAFASARRAARPGWP